MSQYYKGKRSRNLFDPTSREPFKISRSKIELFLDCPRCFYLDRRLGVGRPPGFPFSLNSAVDTLLKKEFDIHRALKTTHPLMKAYGIDAIPFDHKDLAVWRENFKGVQYLEPKTNLIITGAIDDVWCDSTGELMVVDYKATSKDGEVNIDADWQMGYKRQIEMYQWLLRQNGFQVSDTGYFVYVNGRTDVKAFDAKLEFDVKIIPYQGGDKWVSGAIADLHKCLMSEQVPTANSDCDYCSYREAAGKALI
ncbi:MAG: PD-(D/E)XK nuclease family protein [Candidatus Parcubacteria bacterium]|nr:PD-(D/E)XK nuclease family protein [Candidatus Parcubacteria bacterium]